MTKLAEGQRGRVKKSTAIKNREGEWTKFQGAFPSELERLEL